MEEMETEGVTPDQIYQPGVVVWVKISGMWWPAEVKDQTTLDPEVTEGLKKPPLAVVQFLKEETYEHIKSYDNIYLYNCKRKEEFLKLGFKKYYKLKNEKNMGIYPEIIQEAERRTGGDPEIINDPELLPPEVRENKLSNGGRNSLPANSKGKQTHAARRSAPASSGRRESEDSVYEGPTIIEKQGPTWYPYPKHIWFESENRTPPSDDPSIVKEEVVGCCLCSFETTNFDLLMLHHTYKQHNTARNKSYKWRNPLVKKKLITTKKTLVKKKSKKDVESTDKQEKKLKKKKAKHALLSQSNESAVASDVDATLANPLEVSQQCEEILKDWDDEEDETKVDSEDLLNYSASTNDNTMDVIELDETAENSTSAVILPKVDESSAPKASSCFDFDDDEPSEPNLQSLKFGQKLPRVITPEKSKPPDPADDKHDLENLLKQVSVPEIPSLPTMKHESLFSRGDRTYGSSPFKEAKKSGEPSPDKTKQDSNEHVSNLENNKNDEKHFLVEGPLQSKKRRSSGHTEGAEDGSASKKCKKGASPKKPSNEEVLSSNAAENESSKKSADEIAKQTLIDTLTYSPKPEDTTDSQIVPCEMKTSEVETNVSDSTLESSHIGKEESPKRNRHEKSSMKSEFQALVKQRENDVTNESIAVSEKLKHKKKWISESKKDKLLDELTSLNVAQGLSDRVKIHPRSCRKSQVNQSVTSEKSQEPKKRQGKNKQDETPEAKEGHAVDVKQDSSESIKLQARSSKKSRSKKSLPPEATSEDLDSSGTSKAKDTPTLLVTQEVAEPVKSLPSRRSKRNNSSAHENILESTTPGDFETNSNKYETSQGKITSSLRGAEEAPEAQKSACRGSRKSKRFKPSPDEIPEPSLDKEYETIDSHNVAEPKKITTSHGAQGHQESLKLPFRASRKSKRNKPTSANEISDLNIVKERYDSVDSGKDVTSKSEITAGLHVSEEHVESRSNESQKTEGMKLHSSGEVPDPTSVKEIEGTSDASKGGTSEAKITASSPEAQEDLEPPKSASKDSRKSKRIKSASSIKVTELPRMIGTNDSVKDEKSKDVTSPHAKADFEPLKSPSGSCKEKLSESTSPEDTLEPTLVVDYFGRDGKSNAKEVDSPLSSQDIPQSIPSKSSRKKKQVKSAPSKEISEAVVLTANSKSNEKSKTAENKLSTSLPTLEDAEPIKLSPKASAQSRQIRSPSHSEISDPVLSKNETQDAGKEETETKNMDDTKEITEEKETIKSSNTKSLSPDKALELANSIAHGPHGEPADSKVRGVQLELQEVISDNQLTKPQMDSSKKPSAEVIETKKPTDETSSLKMSVFVDRKFALNDSSSAVTVPKSGSSLGTEIHESSNTKDLSDSVETDETVRPNSVCADISSKNAPSKSEPLSPCPANNADVVIKAPIADGSQLEQSFSSPSKKVKSGNDAPDSGGLQMELMISHSTNDADSANKGSDDVVGYNSEAPSIIDKELEPPLLFPSNVASDKRSHVEGCTLGPPSLSPSKVDAENDEFPTKTKSQFEDRAAEPVDKKQDVGNVSEEGCSNNLDVAFPSVPDDHFSLKLEVSPKLDEPPPLSTRTFSEPLEQKANYDGVKPTDLKIPSAVPAERPESIVEATAGKDLAGRKEGLENVTPLPKLSPASDSKKSEEPVTTPSKKIQSSTSNEHKRSSRSSSRKDSRESKTESTSTLDEVSPDDVKFGNKEVTCRYRPSKVSSGADKDQYRPKTTDEAKTSKKSLKSPCRDLKQVEKSSRESRSSTKEATSHASEKFLNESVSKEKHSTSSKEKLSVYKEQVQLNKSQKLKKMDKSPKQDKSGHHDKVDKVPKEETPLKSPKHEKPFKSPKHEKPLKSPKHEKPLKSPKHEKPLKSPKLEKSESLKLAQSEMTPSKSKSHKSAKHDKPIKGSKPEKSAETPSRKSSRNKSLGSKGTTDDAKIICSLPVEQPQSILAEPTSSSGQGDQKDQAFGRSVDDSSSRIDDLKTATLLLDETKSSNLTLPPSPISNKSVVGDMPQQTSVDKIEPELMSICGTDTCSTSVSNEGSEKLQALSAVKQIEGDGTETFAKIVSASPSKLQQSSPVKPLENDAAKNTPTEECGSSAHSLQYKLPTDQLLLKVLEDSREGAVHGPTKKTDVAIKLLSPQKVVSGDSDCKSLTSSPKIKKSKWDVESPLSGRKVSESETSSKEESDSIPKTEPLQISVADTYAVGVSETSPAIKQSTHSPSKTFRHDEAASLLEELLGSSPKSVDSSTKEAVSPKVSAPESPRLERSRSSKDSPGFKLSPSKVLIAGSGKSVTADSQDTGGTLPSKSSKTLHPEVLTTSKTSRWDSPFPVRSPTPSRSLMSSPTKISQTPGKKVKVEIKSGLGRSCFKSSSESNVTSEAGASSLTTPSALEADTSSNHQSDDELSALQAEILSYSAMDKIQPPPAPEVKKDVTELAKELGCSLDSPAESQSPESGQPASKRGRGKKESLPSPMKLRKDSKPVQERLEAIPLPPDPAPTKPAEPNEAATLAKLLKDEDEFSITSDTISIPLDEPITQESVRSPPRDLILSSESSSTSLTITVPSSGAADVKVLSTQYMGNGQSQGFGGETGLLDIISMPIVFDEDFKEENVLSDAPVSEPVPASGPTTILQPPRPSPAILPEPVPAAESTADIPLPAEPPQPEPAMPDSQEVASQELIETEIITEHSEMEQETSSEVTSTDKNLLSQPWVRSDYLELLSKDRSDKRVYEVKRLKKMEYDIYDETHPDYTYYMSLPRCKFGGTNFLQSWSEEPQRVSTVVPTSSTTAVVFVSSSDQFKTVSPCKQTTSSIGAIRLLPSSSNQTALATTMDVSKSVFSILCPEKGSPATSSAKGNQIRLVNSQSIPLSSSNTVRQRVVTQLPKRGGSRVGLDIHKIQAHLKAGKLDPAVKSKLVGLANDTEVMTKLSTSKSKMVPPDVKVPQQRTVLIAPGSGDGKSPLHKSILVSAVGSQEGKMAQPVSTLAATPATSEVKVHFDGQTKNVLAEGQRTKLFLAFDRTGGISASPSIMKIALNPAGSASTTQNLTPALPGVSTVRPALNVQQQRPRTVQRVINSQPVSVSRSAQPIVLNKQVFASGAQPKIVSRTVAIKPGTFSSSALANKVVVSSGSAEQQIFVVSPTKPAPAVAPASDILAKALADTDILPSDSEPFVEASSADLFNPASVVIAGSLGTDQLSTISFDPDPSINNVNR